MDLKMASQFGRPKLVAARNPVMVSVSALASLIMMLVASSDLMLAVRYWSGALEQIESAALFELFTHRMYLDVAIQVLRLNRHE